MANLKLQIGYIVDAMIDVKEKRFGERFVSVKDALIMKKIMELRLKKEKLRVNFVDTLFSNYFRVDNDVITKPDGETLKMYISDERIRQVIYDEELIYYCLSWILMSKLNNSMEHSCSTCCNNCEDFKEMASENTCSDWSHNLVGDCLVLLTMEERQLIEEDQVQETAIKKFIKKTKNI